MASSPRSPEAEANANANADADARKRKRKRKRSSASPDPLTRPHPPPYLPASQDATGVYVDIPAPSSSAIAAALHPAAGSQASTPPSSMFDTSTQQHQETQSEYVPLPPPPPQQQQQQQREQQLRPLPSIPVHAFQPFLDDSTGQDLDSAQTHSQSQLHGEVELVRQSSSPVESFSPDRGEEVVMRPEDVPRIGAWVLPRLTKENSRSAPPDYSSQEVRSQIPFVVGEQDDFDDDEAEARQMQRPRGAELPIQSTPAVTAAVAAVEVEKSMPPPIASQREPEPEHDIPCSTPALPSTATQPLQPQPSSISNTNTNTTTTNTTTTTTTTTTSSSSLSAGWSTLPKPEIIELVHRSSHIPSFLKDEIERFILRANRTSSKSSSSPRRGSPRRRSNSQSQSQSQTQTQSRSNNDDSETQEDGLLRTKKLWYMDLLLFPAMPEATQGGGWSELIQRLSQSQTASSSASGGQAVAIILLLDTATSTFDVHQLEDSLAQILRADRRYSCHYNADGRTWNLDNPHATGAGAGAGAGADQVDSNSNSISEEQQAEITRLETKLDLALQENDTLRACNRSLTVERDEAVAQHEFVRTLYDRASASSASAQAEAREMEEKLALASNQLTHGLALHKAALEDAVSRWKQRLRSVEAEMGMLRRQVELSEADEVRAKAVKWDMYVAEEEERERNRQERARINEQKRQKLAAELGIFAPDGDEQQQGLGPFAPAPAPASTSVAAVAVDQDDELAALAREAAEAGDTHSLDADSATGGRRRRRGNASNRPPPTAAEIQETLQAAQFSSANAQSDSRQDVEDQFQLFPPSSSSSSTTTISTSTGTGMGFGMPDFTAAPSADLDSLVVDAVGEQQQRWEESFNSSDLPPRVYFAEPSAAQQSQL